jgi:hypothetical protein
MTKKCTRPEFPWKSQKKDTILQGPVTCDGKSNLRELPERVMPLEYAVSGWFKFTETERMAVYFNLRGAGDDDLLFGVRFEGGKLYVVATQNDEFHGAVGVRLAFWHFVYVGYSRIRKQLFALAWFRDGEVGVPITGVRHYLSRDGLNLELPGEGFLGSAAYAQVTTGPGAFSLLPQKVLSGDFGWDIGETQLLPLDAHEHLPGEEEWTSGVEVLSASWTGPSVKRST